MQNSWYVVAPRKVAKFPVRTKPRKGSGYKAFGPVVVSYRD